MGARVAAAVAAAPLLHPGLRLLHMLWDSSTRTP